MLVSPPHPPFDLGSAWSTWRALAARLGPVADWARHALAGIAKEAGVPVVVVAAIALVLSLRIARRAVRIVVEITVAAVILAVASQHGWVRF